ncbi:hypothetical protein CKO12_02335 [Chromatium okenii]|nr:hypothetical protein [Chromatium okenii]
MLARQPPLVRQQQRAELPVFSWAIPLTGCAFALSPPSPALRLAAQQPVAAPEARQCQRQHQIQLQHQQRVLTWARALRQHRGRCKPSLWVPQQSQDAPLHCGQWRCVRQQRQWFSQRLTAAAVPLAGAMVSIAPPALVARREVRGQRRRSD